MEEIKKSQENPQHSRKSSKNVVSQIFWGSSRYLQDFNSQKKHFQTLNVEVRVLKKNFSSQENRILGHKHRAILRGNGTNRRPNRKDTRFYCTQKQTFQIMNMLFLVYSAVILLMLLMFFFSSFSIMQQYSRTFSESETKFFTIKMILDCVKENFSILFLFSVLHLSVFGFVRFSEFCSCVCFCGFLNSRPSFYCLFSIFLSSPLFSLQPNFCFTSVLLLFLLFLFVLPHILLAFYLYLLYVCVLMAFQTQMQNRRVLATQFPKSQPCLGGSSKSQRLQDANHN